MTCHSGTLQESKMDHVLVQPVPAFGLHSLTTGAATLDATDELPAVIIDLGWLGYPLAIFQLSLNPQLLGVLQSLDRFVNCGARAHAARQIRYGWPRTRPRPG